MQRRMSTGEEGQSLVQFALVVLTLFAFVALAVDAGNAFVIRRKLQNAADAAALAAAVEICLGKSPEQAETIANTYLVKNGARPFGLVSSGNSTITFTESNRRINIAARGGGETIFGDLLDDINNGQIEVSASANAACGATTSACGLWPIVFSNNLWTNSVGCGKTIAVWDAANANQQVECVIAGVYEPNLCKCYDCDGQDIGKDDFLVVSDVSRGWLDFPVTDDPMYPDSCKEAGSGANELKCTVANGFTGRINLPKWITALNGVKASTFKEVEDRIGDTVRIPLYGEVDAQSMSGTRDPDVNKFKVTKFGCATVDGVVKNQWLQPLPGMPKSYKKIKITAVMVTKSCDICTTSCGTTDGTIGESWELRASNLTK